ncbi:hypothetical protein QQF64_000077 [Cirrhinus molitorella]|uniref:Secreted protein n=1 Tax=Cirrhinus molitorella TaxID=172907 RepID=A0ABR3NWJ3_9TELE
MNVWMWMIWLIFREVASAPVIPMSTRHPECVVCVTGARGQTKIRSSQLLALNLERPPGATDPPPIDTHTNYNTHKKRKNMRLTALRSLKTSSGFLKRQQPRKYWMDSAKLLHCHFKTKHFLILTQTLEAAVEPLLWHN